MPIRIVVGGPPNSGKSTFTASLIKAVRVQEANAQLVELDIWSPTLDYLQGRMTKEQRDGQKRRCHRKRRPRCVQPIQKHL